MQKSLKRLVIDTATPHLYLGLYDGDKEIDSYYKEGRNDHSVKLMVELEQMLNRTNNTMQVIDEIVIGIGPGSYTGLRVGVVVAKMFAWTLGIPVYQVSSLALLASSIEEGFIIPAVDARRGNAFLGLYQIKQGEVVLEENEELANLASYQEKHQADTIFHGKPDMGKLFDTNLLEQLEDVHQLVPNYLRLTEAEKNAKK